MNRRLAAWMIFFGFLGLLAVATASAVGSRLVQYGIWSFWLVSAAVFVWVYAQTGSSAERSRLVDTRGVHLLPRSVRRWLFDT